MFSFSLKTDQRLTLVTKFGGYFSAISQKMYLRMDDDFYFPIKIVGSGVACIRYPVPHVALSAQKWCCVRIFFSCATVKKSEIFGCATSAPGGTDDTTGTYSVYSMDCFHDTIFYSKGVVSSILVQAMHTLNTSRRQVYS